VSGKRLGPAEKIMEYFGVKFRQEEAGLYLENDQKAGEKPALYCQLIGENWYSEVEGK